MRSGGESASHENTILENNRIQPAAAYRTIVDAYVLVLHEYFQYMRKIRSWENYLHILYVGLNTIIHVFTKAYCHTKNIDNTYMCCQKAYICYLEYVEQMNTTHSLHNLDTSDAVLFVYRISMEDVDDQRSDFTHPLDNPPLIKDIYFITKCILFYTEDAVTDDDITVLLQTHLKPFLLLQMPIQIYNYIFDIQCKLKMNRRQYDKYLHEVYKKFRKMRKWGVICPDKILLHESYLHKCFAEDNYKKMCGYVSNEKYHLLVSFLFDF